MDGRRWSEVKLHGGLHMGFVNGGDLYAIELRVTQLWAVGFKEVLAGFERGEAVNAVFGGDGAGFGAGGLIPKDDGCASERRRVQVSEFAGEGTPGLGGDGDSGALEKHGNRDRLDPVRSFPNHLDT